MTTDEISRAGQEIIALVQDLEHATGKEVELISIEYSCISRTPKAYPRMVRFFKKEIPDNRAPAK